MDPDRAAAIADGFDAADGAGRGATAGPDDATARVRSVYTVLQQAPDSPMQTIISGRYSDTLKRIGGRWRFTERGFLVDLVGDLSRHLRFELPS